MDFVKVHGLSNDFIVIDGPYRPDPLDVARWCERRTGVGADGVLVIEPIDSGRMSMRYWNADGGEAVVPCHGRPSSCRIRDRASHHRDVRLANASLATELNYS